MVREAAAWDVIFDQARRCTSLGGLPLLVVSAGQMEPGWLELQRELPALSAHSTQVTVEGASHDALVVVQPYAEQAADAIAAFLVTSDRVGAPVERGVGERLHADQVWLCPTLRLSRVSRQPARVASKSLPPFAAMGTVETLSGYGGVTRRPSAPKSQATKRSQ